MKKLKLLGIIGKYLLALLIVVALVASTLTTLATEDELTIGQVSVNKPEITVFFDLPNDDGTSQMEAVARLGGEELELASLETFEASGEGVWYIFIVDCSTSMTVAQIRAIRNSITETAETMSDSDRITIITFGVTVDTTVNLSNDKDEIIEAANALIANQRRTLLYDALVRTFSIAGTYGENIPERRAAFVFTDAEDYNVGGYTKEEVDVMLENSPFPIYAIGINNNSRAALDVFGAMVRLSGGAIDVVIAATLENAVKERVESFNSGYVARFLSKTNIITDDKEELTLNVTVDAESYSASAMAVTSRWIPDHVPPQVLSAKQTAPGTIEIQFDKQMLGAGSASSFRIEDENGDLLALRACSYDEETYTATLTLSEQPPSGKVAISFTAVTDASMEKNTVAEPVTIDFVGAEPKPIPTPPPAPIVQTQPLEVSEPINPAIWLFGSLIIALIVLGVTLGVIKSRGGLVRVDGKLRFSGNARQEVFAAEESIESVQYQFVTTKPPELKLRIINGSGSTRDIQTPVSGSLFVGRAAGNDIVFDDPRMSRQHFVIEAKDGNFTVQNLSSSGKTFLNGIPIGTVHPLNEGDKITAGDITFVRI